MFENYQYLEPETLILNLDDLKQLIADRKVIGSRSSFAKVATRREDVEKSTQLTRRRVAFHVPTTPDNLSDDFIKLLDIPRIGIAPAAHVQPIVSYDEIKDKRISEGLKSTFRWYEYYKVEFGMDILLPDGHKIKQLKLMLQLSEDGEVTPDIIAYDVFPDTRVNHVEIIGGEISLGINTALRFVATAVGIAAVGVPLPSLLDIQLNPWCFSWAYDKILIACSGRLNYEVWWDLRHDNIYRGFNPTMIVKKRISIENVKATARAIYVYEPPGWFRSKTIKTCSASIGILPL